MYLSADWLEDVGRSDLLLKLLVRLLNLKWYLKWSFPILTCTGCSAKKSGPFTPEELPLNRHGCWGSSPWMGRSLDRPEFIKEIRTWHNWYLKLINKSINIWQNDGRKKKMPGACKNYSHCCQNCKINSAKQQVLQQSQQTGQQNCAEICQGSTCCAPSLRSPWWDAKAATWVD